MEVLSLRNKPPPGHACLALENLSKRTTAERLARLLAPFGPLDTLMLQERPKRLALACFVSERDAAKCLVSLDGAMLDSQPLVLRKWYTRPTTSPPPVYQTPFAQLVKIMNAYLGFDGWSHVVEGKPCLVALREPSAAGASFEADFVARARVFSAGFDALGEGHGTATDVSRPVAIGLARKAAVTNAVKDVLSRVVIVRHADGRVAAVRVLKPTAPQCCQQPCALTTATRAVAELPPGARSAESVHRNLSLCGVVVD